MIHKKHCARRFHRALRDSYLLSALICWLLLAGVSHADGLFLRVKMLKPAKSSYFIRLGGFIHKSPWYLPKAVIPADTKERIAAGKPSPWIDLVKFSQGRLHGSLNRAGGVAELPNLTIDFVSTTPDKQRTAVIELATNPSSDDVVRRWQETYDGSLTSVLISPSLVKDAAKLETAGEMTARRLRWAHAASKGKRLSPKKLIVQTSFWSPQREQLNLQEAEVLHQLGFNVVGNQRPEVREAFDFHAPGHTHGVRLGPASTQEEVDGIFEKLAQKKKTATPAGVPFGLSDEVISRPAIGENPKALEHFHQWLAEQKLSLKELGVKKLSDVVPIETPVVYRERAKQNDAAARRVFYYTSRFRQHAATERLRWHTEAYHRHFSKSPLAEQRPLTSTLVADHPYFAGSGLGMGATPNAAWGNYPLACDWFELGRTRAVDLIGVEDWMGLQYMYGPNWTWEGFQLMGFQAAIFRSASGGQQPTIAWITPSDETNLRLKSSSALCQGAKHFFYWTYGPTATSTENYWSDLQGSYDGIAAITRQLAAAEHLIAPGKVRKTRVAMLYSISSDLWQPFGYVHMLERRGLYLSLVHDQYLVDFLSEEDVIAGRLANYDVLYTADPCIHTEATQAIDTWVSRGGSLWATAAAGSRNQFNEPTEQLAKVFGIAPEISAKAQPGRYHIRGSMNGMRYTDTIKITSPGEGLVELGVIGVQVRSTPTTANVLGKFGDGSPALLQNLHGKGTATYVGGCAGLAYIKDAKFVQDALKEKWQTQQRDWINHAASRASRLVDLSHGVVECGVYDAPKGTALVLANFTYTPIELKIEIPVRKPIKSLSSVEKGKLKFSQKPIEAKSFSHVVTTTVQLGLNDILLLE